MIVIDKNFIALKETDKQKYSKYLNYLAEALRLGDAEDEKVIAYCELNHTTQHSLALKILQAPLRILLKNPVIDHCGDYRHGSVEDLLSFTVQLVEEIFYEL